MNSAKPFLKNDLFYSLKIIFPDKIIYEKISKQLGNI